MNLADLVVSSPKADREQALAPLAGDCPKHPLMLQGSCLHCKREAEQEHRARQLVSTRIDVRHRRVQEALKPYEAEIAREQSIIAARMAEQYIQTIQTHTYNEAAQPYLERVTAEVDRQLYAEALAEIREQEKKTNGND